jgi:hypothetical protein
VAGEADDALGEADGVVGLQCCGVEERVAPAFAQDHLLPLGRRGGGRAVGGVGIVLEGEFEDDGDRIRRDGDGEGGFDVDCDGGVGGVVDVSDEAPGDDGDSGVDAGGGGDDLPGDFGDVGGDAAVDFAVEGFDDLGTALGPPEFGRGDGLAVVEDEGVGQVGPGVGLRLVVVGEAGGVGIGTDGGAEGGDVEEVEEALLVVGGGERGGVRRGLGEEGGEQEREREDEKCWAKRADAGGEGGGGGGAKSHVCHSMQKLVPAKG